MGKNTAKSITENIKFREKRKNIWSKGKQIIQINSTKKLSFRKREKQN